VIFLLAGSMAKASDHTLSPDHKHYRKLHMYLFGLQAYDYGNPACRTDLEGKYGFNYKEKAGCEVKRIQSFLWDRHNEKVERKMIRRFGKDWEDKYMTDIEKCTKSKR